MFVSNRTGQPMLSVPNPLDCPVRVKDGRSFASTLKVQRSAVGSGSGRCELTRPMSRLGRFDLLTHEHPSGGYAT